MVRFSNDADILKYEPVLFGELHLPWQVQARGTGATLSGTTLACSGADFAAAGVEAGGVVHLRSADGSLDGAYEIVSVDSATELTVTVVRADPADPAVAPPAAEGIDYRIATLAPQGSEAAYPLTELFGIRPGNPSSPFGPEDILDTEVLRRASVFAVISSVYAMLASRAGDDNHWAKSLHYRRLFEKARQRCRLSLGASTDPSKAGADVTRLGGAVRLVRD